MCRTVARMTTTGDRQERSRVRQGIGLAIIGALLVLVAATVGPQAEALLLGGVLLFFGGLIAVAVDLLRS